MQPVKINRPIEQPECDHCGYLYSLESEVIPCKRITWTRYNALGGCPWFECEMCANTGSYGNNGPGIEGNEEYQDCDYCEFGCHVSDQIEEE